jgi:glycine cleavage system H protein
MDAGAVAFRLCDRGFECEHCPFDAAMRGTSLAADADASDTRTQACVWSFPTDRLYTNTHLWVQKIDRRHVRTGLDAFAAHLLHPALRIRQVATPLPASRGDPWCAIGTEGGDAWLSMPISGYVREWNHALLDEPALASADSYERGWLADIVPKAHGPHRTLFDAIVAQSRAQHDAHQYRRQCALQLLSESTSSEQATSEQLRSMRSLLGRVPRIALARQFLHWS